jgi:P-type Ca2+ transporter type 2C
VNPHDRPAIAAGLGAGEAQQRLERDGPNELPVSRQRGLLRLAREVASEPMFLLLVACGAIYMVLGDPPSAGCCAPRKRSPARAAATA